VQFAKEQLTFTGEDTAMATLLLSVMGAFAEFERSLIQGCWFRSCADTSKWDGWAPVSAPLPRSGRSFTRSAMSGSSTRSRADCHR